MYFVTIPELEEKLKSQGKQVLALKPYTPLMTQLLTIPAGSEIMATVPDEWPTAEKERFTARIHEALLHIEITRNTINAFQDKWIENAFWNYETCISAPPIDKLQKTGEYALVVGSGPSSKEAHAYGKPQIFAAWSSPAASVADVIGHCDHTAQNNPNANPKQAIVLTPTASKEFIPAFPDTVPYVYFDRGNPINWRFAEKRNLPDHEPILGNVVDMLVQCAIYAGHTKIKLIGVDLSCKEPEDLFKYHPTAIKATPTQNYNGQVVYTDEIFTIYQKGLEGLAHRYPEIEFSVLSPEGVILEGIPYEQL